MDLIKNNRYLFILLSSLVFVLMLYFFFSLLFSSPKIKKTYPENGSSNIPVSAVIKIEFDKKINKNLILVQISPSTNTQTTFTSNSLQTKPVQNLKYGTNYTVTVGDRLTNKDIAQFYFITIIPQGDSGTAHEIESATKEFYPLAPFSPPNNANFYFIYAGQLKMNVFLKGNKETAKKEFEDWAKSKGVDLSTHQIQYLTPP